MITSTCGYQPAVSRGLRSTITVAAQWIASVITAVPRRIPAGRRGPEHPPGGVKWPTMIEGARRAVTGGGSFNSRRGSEADRRLDSQAVRPAHVFPSGIPRFPAGRGPREQVVASRGVAVGTRDGQVAAGPPRPGMAGRKWPAGRIRYPAGPRFLPAGRILPVDAPGRAAGGADGDDVTRVRTAVRAGAGSGPGSPPR